MHEQLHNSRAPHNCTPERTEITRICRLLAVLWVLLLPKNGVEHCTKDYPVTGLLSGQSGRFACRSRSDRHYINKCQKESMRCAKAGYLPMRNNDFAIVVPEIIPVLNQQENTPKKTGWVPTLRGGRPKDILEHSPHENIHRPDTI